MVTPGVRGNLQVVQVRGECTHSTGCRNGSLTAGHTSPTIGDLNRVSYWMRPRAPGGSHENSAVEAGDDRRRRRLAARHRRGCGCDCEHGQRGTASASAVKVGFIYSRTGALAGFGAEEVEGFQYGLKYLKAQHNTCGGHKLSVTYVDDQKTRRRPSMQRRSLGQGYKIIAGATSSGVATHVAPIADRTSPLPLRPCGCRCHHRRQPAHVPLGPAELPGRPDGRGHPASQERWQEGRRLRGGHRVRASNFAAVSQVFGGKGHIVSKLLVPFQAADLTPYAQQLKNANADLVFVA